MRSTPFSISLEESTKEKVELFMLREGINSRSEAIDRLLNQALEEKEEQNA